MGILVVANDITIRISQIPDLYNYYDNIDMRSILIISVYTIVKMREMEKLVFNYWIF